LLAGTLHPGKLSCLDKALFEQVSTSPAVTFEECQDSTKGKLVLFIDEAFADGFLEEVTLRCARNIACYCGVLVVLAGTGAVAATLLSSKQAGGNASSRVSHTGPWARVVMMRQPFAKLLCNSTSPHQQRLDFLPLGAWCMAMQ